MCYFRDVIQPQEWLTLYDSLSPNLKGYQPVERTYEKIRAMVEMHNNIMYKDITGVNVDGKTVSLSDYIGKGKYVLVDFWATWCGPCRMEAKQTLLPLYEKYKDNKNFMILGVMTSDNVDSHLKGLKSLNYPWTQFIDKDNLAGRTYGFDGIPFIVLFGPDGKIISRGIRGEEIWKAVGAVLEK